MCVWPLKKRQSDTLQQKQPTILLPDAQTYYSVRLFRTTCLILIRTEPRQRESSTVNGATFYKAVSGV